MLVTYVAPNGSWHYNYARALNRAGMLQRFICGLSRFSPRAPMPELGRKLRRVDLLQSLFIASSRLKMPALLNEELSYLSKIALDRCASRDAMLSDIFLFYSGAGLRTLQALKGTATRGIVEAVNSHVLVQKAILQEEYDRLKLTLNGFHQREVTRRVKEYELADGIICPSSFARQSYIEQGVPADRVRLVPFGIHHALSAETGGRSQEVFRVLYVGQINIRKGLRYLFEAFENFKHPNKELLIVGPRSDPTGIDDLKPPEQTRFLGILKGEELANAYRSCHVFVLPSLEEGLALVLGEALSHGLPVIATFNSGGADLFRDGSTGFLVPIRSPSAITEKLQLLADSPDLLADFSARAVARDNGIGTWENTYQTLIRTLRDFSTTAKL